MDLFNILHLVKNEYFSESIRGLFFSLIDIFLFISFRLPIKKPAPNHFFLFKKNIFFLLFCVFVEQRVVLQVNGVAVDVGVITKDADFELNNNQSAEMAEKLMKIPEEENLMEKSLQLSVDEQEKNAQPCEKNSMTADNGKEIGKTSDDKPLEGDLEVVPNATVVVEEKSDTCSSSSSSADSESSPTAENSDKSEKSEGSIEELASDTVTSAANDTKGHAEINVDAVESTTDADSDENATANADAEQPQQQQQQQNDTQQTAEKTDQTTKTENSPSKSPSKKKSSPKKRKNRSRSQKKPFDYSQLVNYTLTVTQRSRRYFLNVPRGRTVPTPSDDCEIFSR